MNPDKVKRIQDSPELYPIEFLVQRAEQLSETVPAVQAQPASLAAVENPNSTEKEITETQAAIIRTTQGTREMYRQILADNQDVLRKLRKVA